MAPAWFMAERVIGAGRNVVYWDEFDTALSFVLELDRGMGVREFVSRVFAVSNEHRMVTSRMMFAVSYWLTGSLDFRVINAIGNASLVVLCVLLVFSQRTADRRLRLALVLAMLMFQLQHYENFLWSGSSVDHFQVVLLASAALVGLAFRTRTGLLLGALCAVLATFTLAHGTVVWVVGAAMLGYARRWRHLGVWCAAGAFAGAGFLLGFHINTAQRFTEPTLAGAFSIVRYWLSLLGAVPAFGLPALAPWLGAALLGALAGIGWRGGVRRETVAYPVALYAVGAALLIAVGRAAESGGALYSRYYVLSALAWALVVFMGLNRFSHPRRPRRLLWLGLPILIAFNLAANRHNVARAESWIECRDRAAVRFKQHGADGLGPFSLHPVPARSTALLKEAERRGIYRMSPVCREVPFGNAKPSSRIAYFVEEIAVDVYSAAVVGWAAIPDRPSRRGELHLVLRSATETRVFTTVTVTRPDVATALKRPEWELSGFRFARRRDRLPEGDYQIGFLIKHEGGPEYIMTAHRVRLIGEGEALLATAE